MKEFRTQSGGRHTFTDDFINLQNLALAFGEIFSGCGNFIVSGCKYANGKISKGYAWIDGKMREVPETPVSSSPVFIVPSDSTENVPFQSGGSKVGRQVYGAKVTTVYSPGCIYYYKDDDEETPTLKSEFFGKYALLKKPFESGQETDSELAVNGLTVKGYTRLQGGFSFSTTEGDLTLARTRDTFTLTAQSKGDEHVSIELEEQGRIALSVADRPQVVVEKECTTFNVPVALRDRASISGLKVEEESIRTAASTVLSLNVMDIDREVLGGGVSIGDGRTAVIHVPEGQGSVYMNGKAVFGGRDAFYILSPYELPERYIKFVSPLEDVEFGVLGLNMTTHRFRMESMWPMDIKSVAVNIDGQLRLNNKPLSELFIQKTEDTGWLHPVERGPRYRKLFGMVFIQGKIEIDLSSRVIADLPYDIPAPKDGLSVLAAMGDGIIEVYINAGTKRLQWRPVGGNPEGTSAGLVDLNISYCDDN